MERRCRQLTLTLTAVSLLSVCTGQSVDAQATPPINPNADSPVEDLDLGDIDVGDGGLDDVEGAAEEIEAVTNDVDAA
ncbi:MAG: hypothetical protein AAGA01_09470, partial [Cyanobacteria bacterium P01_E01_bin.43]